MRELGHPMAELPWGRGPPAGSPDSPFRLYPLTFRHVWMTKRPRNPTKQGPCIRIEDSSATVQESCRSDFGASRKAPKTKGYTHEKAKRRRVAEPRAPQLGSWLWGSAIAEPCRRDGSAIPWPSSPGAGDPLQGPP